MINKLILLLLLVGSSAMAQNSVRVLATTQRTVSANYSKDRTYSYFKFVHPYDFYFDQKVKEYEERMVANVKKHKKLEKLMKKPQYTDPSYFGHKRKPKKRKPGKRKFCTECEIVH